MTSECEEINNNKCDSNELQNQTQAVIAETIETHTNLRPHFSCQLKRYIIHTTNKVLFAHFG